MTAVKLDSKPSTAAAVALLPHADGLFRDPTKRLVALVELTHVERTQPGPDEDKEQTVKVRITHLEIGDDKLEEPLRRAMRALYTQRTAYGTLDQDTGEIELGEDTVRSLAGDLLAIEAARLRVAMLNFASYARQALKSDEITLSGAIKDLNYLANGLRAVANGDRDPDS